MQLPLGARSPVYVPAQMRMSSAWHGRRELSRLSPARGSSPRTGTYTAKISSRRTAEGPTVNLSEVRSCHRRGGLKSFNSARALALQASSLTVLMYRDLWEPQFRTSRLLLRGGSPGKQCSTSSGTFYRCRSCASTKFIIRGTCCQRNSCSCLASTFSRQCAGINVAFYQFRRQKIPLSVPSETRRSVEDAGSDYLCWCGSLRHLNLRPS
ncbi:hypothetical protein R3P38DRAFT_2011 [Favolaschia claudopus]|uniref:Uncharacterized protein n=1 Tax=Favolaschia claudopus TaxID=2862362 RepID=A0AAW0EF35_9AGAR